MTYQLFSIYFHGLFRWQIILQEYFLELRDLDKIKITAILFVVFQLIDLAISYIGISLKGISFEKNQYAVYLIQNFGILSIIFFKLLLASSALIFVFKFSAEESQKKFIFFVYIILTIISFYGASSAIFGLFI